jgi:hypothetical protein
MRPPTLTVMSSAVNPYCCAVARDGENQPSAPAHCAREPEGREKVAGTLPEGAATYGGKVPAT